MMSRMRPPICFALTLILTACGPLNPSPTSHPDAHPFSEPAPSPSSPTTQLPTPSLGQPASPTQSANPPTTDDLQRDSVVEVVRDGVAVYSGPGSGYPHVEATRTRPSGVETVGPYLLSVGERLIIQDGPIRLGGSAWYSVRPAGLVSLGDLFFAEGWVPVDEGGDAYLEPSATPDASCCFSASGMGIGASVQVPPPAACSAEAGCARAIAWAAGLADPTGGCTLRITEERSATVIVDQRIEGWARGAAWWPEHAEAAIVVETNCSWSLHVGPA